MAPDPARPVAGFAIYDWRWLLVATILAGLYLDLTLEPGNALTVLLGLFVLFAAPGYGIAALLFGNPGRRLSRAANLAMVVGFSVLYNGIVGLLLLVGAFGLHASILGAVALIPLVWATLVQLLRRVESPKGSVVTSIRGSLQFPGFSRTQRQVAWVLLAGTVLAFGAIAYEATIVPLGPNGLSIAVTGPDGTTSTLPTHGAVNQSMSVLLTLQSPHGTIQADLVVQAILLGNGSASNVTVPWNLPLVLGPGTSSSNPVAIPSGSSISVPVSFVFAKVGTYTVTFSISEPGASQVASAQLSEVIR